MKIFIDVDNTILEHTTFYNSKTEGRLHKIFNLDPVAHETSIQRMYEGSVCSDVQNFKKIFYLDNVYILTKTSNDIYEKHKRIRLAKLLGIEVEEMMAYKDANGHPKYITVDEHTPKSEFIMNLLDIDNISDCILVDDYSKNIIEWEEDGGIGIKFNNQYNTNYHPCGGVIISNFKLFTYMIEGNTFDHLIIEPKIAYYFKKTYPNANYINYLTFIKNFVKDTFKIKEHLKENTKSPITDFMANCYSFIELYNSSILKEYYDENKKQDLLNIVINPFDYTYVFKDIVKTKNTLTIGYSSSEKDIRLRDISISVPTELYEENSYETIVKSMKLIERFGNYKFN